jgi:MscS family membrane protein
LENRWLLEHLPKWALRVGTHELRWWQMIALVPLLFVAWCLSFAINRVAWLLLKRWLPEHGAETARKLHGPAKLAWTIVAAYALLPWLSLYEPSDEFVRRGLSAAFLVAFFWALWKAVELSQHAVSSAVWAKSSPTSASIVTFGARVGKLVVAAFAFVAVLAELGYPVASIITGLGIGGIALALAAQKTVENLFGAFSLAIDQPFREGDTVTVDTVTGTVELIGLRSTRIRTADRTLVTIPNGKLAEMRIETLSARDRLRLYFVLGLAHTDGETLTKVVHGIEKLLRASELLVTDSASVRLIALTDSAMNIEVAAMLQTTDNAVFLAARQGFLLDIVALAEREGAALAQPVNRITWGESSKP